MKHISFRRLDLRILNTKKSLRHSSTYPRFEATFQHDIYGSAQKLECVNFVQTYILSFRLNEIYVRLFRRLQEIGVRKISVSQTYGRSRLNSIPSSIKPYSKRQHRINDAPFNECSCPRKQDNKVTLILQLPNGILQ